MNSVFFLPRGNTLLVAFFPYTRCYLICWFCGDNFDVDSNLHSHLFLYVASSAFESIMIAIYPFWESLKVTWLKSTNSSMISNSWLGITRPGNSDPN
ncbi:hypothetical protein Hanom_Chr16g01420901 [Helianthus anomalus]